MRTTILIFSLICSSLLLGFIPKKTNPKQYDAKYYVATGWEEMGGGKRKNPAITNVVYVACNHYHSTTTVTNQLDTHYKAYYKKSRSSVSFGDKLAWVFDTKSAAEKKRIELIAKWNDDKLDVLFIDRFSVLCDEK